MTRDGGIIVPDFRAELRLALDNAEPVDPVDPFDNTARASKEVDQPDGKIIHSFFIPRPNQVYTTDPDQYRSLLEQTTELLASHWQGERGKYDLAMATYVDETVTHELAHASAARIGNPLIRSNYCVELLLEEDGTYDFRAFHTVDGRLKKVHRAWAAAAPPDRSDVDIELVRSLGYDPNDIDGLHQRAIAEPPLEPTPELDGSLQNILSALLNDFLGPEQ